MSKPAIVMSPCFLCHPGLGPNTGAPSQYWEYWPEAHFRLAQGDVRITEVLAVPALPPAWMPGRFFIHLVRPGVKTELVEITPQVGVDLESGLACCPEWLREQYRLLVEERRKP